VDPAFSGSISGFDGNDTIVLDAAAANFSFGLGVLTLIDGALPGVIVAQLTMIGPYSVADFKLVPGNPASSVMFKAWPLAAPGERGTYVTSNPYQRR
jgi:hypothetical protein